MSRPVLLLAFIAGAFGGCSSADVPMPKSLLTLNEQGRSGDSAIEGASAAGPSLSPGEPQPEKTEMADAPVPTAGVFLVCAEDLSLEAAADEVGAGCRLTDKDGVKIANLAPLNPRLTPVRGDGTPLSADDMSLVRIVEEGSSVSPWHWLVRYPRRLAPIAFVATVSLPSGGTEILRPRPIDAAPLQRVANAAPFRLQALGIAGGDTADGALDVANLTGDYPIPGSFTVDLSAGQAQKIHISITLRLNGTPAVTCEYGTNRSNITAPARVELTPLSCSGGKMAGSIVRMNGATNTLRERALPAGVANDNIPLTYRMPDVPLYRVEPRPIAP